MPKLHRLAAAFVASILVVAAGPGCSTSDDSSSTNDSNLEESAARARFTPYLNTLKSTLESGKPTDEIAKRLLDSGRPAAFSLQALCRVYGDADPKFKEMRDDFKGLEDGIGAYDKWYTIYQQALSENKDAATLARLKQQSDDALAEFTKLLTDRQWLTTGGAPTRLSTIETFLNGFAWGTRADDRKRVLKPMIKELKDIKETTYDMKILEVGNGIHELRRDIRWVLIEQLALNGMITTKDDCPIPAYASIPNDNRYGALHASPSEPNPCQVSGCLVFAAAKTVSDLGDLKDQAEVEVNIANGADVVPERLQPAAKAIYDGIVQNDLVGKYQEQLEACRDAQ